MRIAIAAALAVSLAAPVAANTLSKDEKKAARFAVPSAVALTKKPKGLCVCIKDVTAESVHGMGILTYRRGPSVLGQQIVVECRVLKYDGQTEERKATDVCDEWVPLSK
jgi:hypothetical protein